MKVWILIFYAYSGGYPNSGGPQTIENIISGEECMRVAKVISDTKDNNDYRIYKNAKCVEVWKTK